MVVASVVSMATTHHYKWYEGGCGDLCCVSTSCVSQLSLNALQGKRGTEVLKGMAFDSPDAEKYFPGLYASESGKMNNESDCTSSFTVLRMKCDNVVLIMV